MKILQQAHLLANKFFHNLFFAFIMKHRESSSFKTQLEGLIFNLFFTVKIELTLNLSYWGCSRFYSSRASVRVCGGLMLLLQLVTRKLTNVVTKRRNSRFNWLQVYILGSLHFPLTHWFR